tara:strand:- start:933 stop:1112 length:180 start_codon:yes stop_codon:yes gene_type:complete
MLRLPIESREVLLHGLEAPGPFPHLKSLFVEKNYYSKTSIPKKVDIKTMIAKIENHINH